MTFAGGAPDLCDDGGMAIKARELRFAVELRASGELLEESGEQLEVPPEWTPEHLLLAALVRCSLTSFEYHAKRAGLEVGARSGTARAMVTKRESDGRYAVVEAELELALEVTPEADDTAELLAKAERDCFVGASLTAKPSYHWTVNGRTIDA
jgi:organic hydroperoxide reductase OsmC/OhrA